MAFVPYHQHLLIKGYCKNPFKSAEDLNNWFKRLVERVGMVVVAGPTSVYVDEEGNEGLTGTVTLATSHSSIHIWDAYEVPMFQFDIYSCKKYEIQEVIDHLNEMELIEFDWMAIDRNEGLSVSDHGSGKGTVFNSTPISQHNCICSN
jgi:S-adenosylmethionine/arginine decarboxylase-like enzyme